VEEVKISHPLDVEHPRDGLELVQLYRVAQGATITLLFFLSLLAETLAGGA
jgi:hypothetical protein